MTNNFKVGDVVELDRSRVTTTIHKYFKIEKVNRYNYDIVSLDRSVKYNCVDEICLQPVEQQEFTWDKSVPTIGEPILSKYDNNWYIEVDRSKPTIFDKPMTAKIADGSINSLIGTFLCAIVPNSQYPFSLDCGCSNRKVYLPVTYTPKVQEMTVEQIEEKLGHKIKIVAKE